MKSDFCPYYKDKSCQYIVDSTRCFEKYENCFIYERTNILRASQARRKPMPNIEGKLK